MVVFGNRMVPRGTSPTDNERYNGFISQLKGDEYMVLNRIQEPQIPQHNYFRNALVGGVGLGGLGALYHYRQPLMKLGQRGFNYTRDKFHNLFAHRNAANPNANPNPHNY